VYQEEIAARGMETPLSNGQMPGLPQEMIHGGVAIVTLSLVLLLVRALVTLIRVSKED
jgi:hypothetical protein